MIDGKEILSRLGKLRDVTCSKDIAQLTYAMFPGTHCPLMGAAMAVRGFKTRFCWSWGPTNAPTTPNT